MGVRIIEGREPWDGACLYCSTAMWAFGPIFENGEQAQAFLDWLGTIDPRLLRDDELTNKYSDFLTYLEERKGIEDLRREFLDKTTNTEIYDILSSAFEEDDREGSAFDAQAFEQFNPEALPEDVRQAWNDYSAYRHRLELL